MTENYTVSEKTFDLLEIRKVDKNTEMTATEKKYVCVCVCVCVCV